jgi:hypothetical protein
MCGAMPEERIFPDAELARYVSDRAETLYQRSINLVAADVTTHCTGAAHTVSTYAPRVALADARSRNQRHSEATWLRNTPRHLWGDATQLCNGRVSMRPGAAALTPRPFRSPTCVCDYAQ